MPRIHVVVNKDHVDPGSLGQSKVVVVLDVIFATTSIVTALANGAAEVIPTVDRDSALREAAGRPQGSYLLAGELETHTLEGFIDPWPGALSEPRVRGKALIYSTTNGTVALNRVRRAPDIYVAALINAEAIVSHVLRRYAERTVLLVCSGSGSRLNLEDFYGAGCLVSLLRREGSYELTDAALTASLFHDRYEAMECLSQSRIARIMLSRGLGDEIAYSAQRNICSVVPRFEDRCVRSV